MYDEAKINEMIRELILKQETGLKQLTLGEDANSVILAVSLISTVSTLTRLKEQFSVCSKERWGSPSELRGTAVRFRLPFSMTVRQLENTLELLRILISISPDWQRTLEMTSEDFYAVEYDFWEAIHTPIRLD